MSDATKDEQDRERMELQERVAELESERDAQDAIDEARAAVDEAPPRPSKRERLLKAVEARQKLVDLKKKIRNDRIAESRANPRRRR